MEIPTVSNAEVCKKPLQSIDKVIEDKLQKIHVENVDEATKLSAKDSIALWKIFLLKEAPKLLLGSGFGIGFWVRLAIVAAIGLLMIFG